jgi:DtxR family Mn-dependent transcriptional regulator
MVTQAVQDYLKAIYKIAESGQSVTTNAIAEKLKVTQASVTGMIKKLAEMNLITHTPYYGAELTDDGKKIALEIIRHHRLLELYLARAMGYSWDRVHDEAEKLEHVISEEFEDKIAELLGNPTADPHGAPIPSRDGTIDIRPLVKLTSLEPGQSTEIKQVSDHDPEKLRYLAEIGIYPGVEIAVLEKAPFDGPLLIRIKNKEHHLGRGLTDNIFVLKRD